ncbi:MAG: hypothetical protein IPL56_03605 [Saprospiraceae bacterium]|nr:hypothetical protein [Saprospiraceae bacterium]
MRRISLIVLAESGNLPSGILVSWEIEIGPIRLGVSDHGLVVNPRIQPLRSRSQNGIR